MSYSCHRWLQSKIILLLVYSSTNLCFLSWVLVDNRGSKDQFILGRVNVIRSVHAINLDRSMNPFDKIQNTIPLVPDAYTLSGFSSFSIIFFHNNFHITLRHRAKYMQAFMWKVDKISMLQDYIENDKYNIQLHRKR